MVATNSMATRSSLELMLDKIQQLEDQPKDIPPALPVRPVSRARLPRARRPLQLDFHRRNSEENDASFKWGGFESKRTKKEDFTESCHQEDIAENDGIAASAAQFDHFQKGIESSENSKEIAEKGISKIQKCYRGHQVRRYYKELRRGTMALQSFIRGENARRGYKYRSRSLRAIILIQKQTRKYFEHKVLEGHQKTVAHLQSGIRGCLDRRRSKEIVHEPKSRKKKPGESRNLGLVADTKDQTLVPYRVLVDLQKRVLRTEAKVREKKEENIVLKRQLQEMEKKWQQYEERMKSMEKEWQDQFTYIQECLAAKKNSAPQIRFGQSDATQRQYNQNPDIITINPNGRTLDFPINSIYHQELVHDEDCNLTEVGQDQVCLKFHPHEELHKLKLRFKAWKKDYKNKLRDAQSTFKKLGNSETAKSQKNWWGRLSY